MIARTGAALVTVALAMAGASCDGCLKQVAVEAIPELGYPSCDGATLPAGEVVAAGELVSGPFMREQDVYERFELRRRDCLYVGTSRQSWHKGISDLEIVFDSALRPLRAWKRTLIPGEAGAHVRRYELRRDPVTIKIGLPTGAVERKQLRGLRPAMVVGPGRGLLSAWLQRAKLEVGESERVPLLDIRGLEKTEPAVLKREADRRDGSLGRSVRVYTFFGCETVFADEHDVVIGDLAGLRPFASVQGARRPELGGVPVPEAANTP